MCCLMSFINEAGQTVFEVPPEGATVAELCIASTKAHRSLLFPNCVKICLSRSNKSI